MAFDPDKPYNDLPTLPPVRDVESARVLKAALRAGRALAELKGIGATIPNQSILIDSLILQEARASSEIENIITTNDALFRAFSSEISATDPATKEVLRYRHALWHGFNELMEHGLLTTNLFVNVCQVLRDTTDGIRRTPGTKLGNPATGQTVYTPPEGEEVIREKLKNLEDFIHEDGSLDPLVKLPLIHYQFEAIHPFSDGNGRTGRIINILYLVQQNLLDLPVLYLSKAIIEHKSDYYRLLRAVTELHEWEAWILYFLDAVENTATHTRDRMQAIRELLNETLEKARKQLPSRVYSKELIELLFRQPYVKGQFLVDSGIAKRKTAAEYLKELEKIGILSLQKVGRESLYLNVGLHNLLSS